ncbi:hypothetical protein AAFC00_000205 [Neodothiora populina]|uniref:Nitrogen permease regulator 2 n=1 Tax=Neodothiora populina TaxID=2781224 RepID=A0ABR3P329_9PEZI
MLKSIFYARFHPEKGSTVLHQVPEGSIIPCPPSPTAQTPLFDYKSVADYIIPRREFCDRLVTIVASKHRVIGFPVCIHDDEKYSRNDFIFNFCLVVDEEAPYAAYASVTRKLARLLRNLEEQGRFLSDEEEMGGLVLAGEVGYGGGSKVYALCEMVLEDLNNYCECMIPIDDSNTVNLKLFPTRAAPPPIHGWHVPLSLVRFPSLQTTAWDLTVQRIIPHIDGINSVARIATLADTDSTLTRRAIAHLLYYGCICLLDIFQFSAVYAPTAEIAVFFADENMQDECRRYVFAPFSPFGKSSAATSTPAAAAADAPPLQPQNDGVYQPGQSMATVRGGSRLNPAHIFNTGTPIATTTTQPPTEEKQDAVDQTPSLPCRSQIISLYASLRPGLPLREWCIAHSSSLSNIDIRRFITFGKIKGFLYRSHKYPIALRPNVSSSPLSSSSLDLNNRLPKHSGVNSTTIAATAQQQGISEQEAAAAQMTLLNQPPGGETVGQARRRNEKAWRKAAMSSGWQTPKGEEDEKENPFPNIDQPSFSTGGTNTPNNNNNNNNNNRGSSKPPSVALASAATSVTADQPVFTSQRGMTRPSGEEDSPGDPSPMNNNNNNGTNGLGGMNAALDPAIVRYLDGLHCMDEICTDLHLSERDVIRKLKPDPSSISGAASGAPSLSGSRLLDAAAAAAAAAGGGAGRAAAVNGGNASTTTPRDVVFIYR